MKTFTSIDLKTLIQHDEYPSISIYLPTHIKGSDTRQNPIRLKNSLNSCQTRLESEYSLKKVFELLRLGFDILSESMSWKHHSRGLALFMSPSYSQYFDLSFIPEEKLHIGKFFHILPLIHILIKERNYYILVLRQKGIKLLQANYNSIHEVELHNVPKSIDEILQYDVDEKHIQMQTTPFGKSAGSDALFHGQGNIADETRRKKNIERYLKAIARGIDKQLQGQISPLVLAGVEYEQAIYRQHSTYKYLMEEGISTEPGQLNNEQLQHKAWNIVQSYLNRDIEKCSANYQNLAKTKMASSNIREILPAAHAGRINTLLVDTNKHVPGTFEPELQQVNIHQSDEAGDEDLLNLAAIYSLKSNAKVYPFTEKKVTDVEPLAVTFRY